MKGDVRIRGYNEFMSAYQEYEKWMKEYARQQTETRKMKVNETNSMDTRKLDASDAVNEFMNRFRSIYSGHEDLALSVFRKIAGYIVGIREYGKPIGTYMSFGPSGSGKSYFWECIAEALHNKRGALVYINGGEYSHSHEVARIIGAPPGYVGYKDGEPAISRTSLDRSRGSSAIPVNIIMVDEIDKAHKSLNTLFLGAMERGCLKTGDGATVDLTDCLIVYTANAGEGIYNSKKFGIPGGIMANSESARKVLLQDFSAAFMNRVDELILFRSYSREERVRAFQIQASRCIDYLGAHKNIVSVTNGFIEAMADIPMTKEFGLRDLTKKMKNLIMDKCRSVMFGESKSGRLTERDVKAMLEAEYGATRNMYSAV